jgi:hypothetical protein
MGITVLQNSTPPLTITDGPANTALNTVRFLRAGCPSVQIFVENGYQNETAPLIRILDLMALPHERFVYGAVKEQDGHAVFLVTVESRQA